MARDFRPKDKSKAKIQSKPAPSGAPTSKQPAARTPQAKPARKQFESSASDDDVDDATLLKEIRAMGGSKEDLDLVGGSKGKGKGKEDAAADPSLSADVQSFMKQLNFGGAAAGAADDVEPTPKAAAKGKQTAAKGKQAAEKEGKKANGQGRKDAQEGTQKSNDKKQGKNAAKGKGISEGGKDVNGNRKSSATQSESAPGQVRQKGGELDWKTQRDQRAATQKVAKPEPTASRKVTGANGAALGEKDSLSAALKPTGKAIGRLVIPPTPHWTTAPLSKLTVPAKGLPKLAEAAIAQLQTRGQTVLDNENASYAAMTESGTGDANATLTASDAKFIRNLLSSSGGGTVSDRISALTLLVQSSPLHNMRAMDTLRGMAAKKGREESGRATRALADWLAGGGGLGANKLKYFRDQPLLAHPEATDAHLCLWAFEDHVKKYYFEFLKLLEAQSHDPLEFVRKQAIIQIFRLLRDKPEQEQNLLRLLVNKLGDTDRAVASKASTQLLDLLQAHPVMNGIVVREISSLILRPATAVASSGPSGGSVGKHNHHARYYGVLTINQTMLTARDTDVATRLVSLYFELFESVLHEAERGGAKDEVQKAGEDGKEDENSKKPKKARWRDSKGSKGKGKGKGKGAAQPEGHAKAVQDAEGKMMAAILAGVRRAFPFATIDDDVFDKHMSTLFRITHSGTFNISIQALQLIFQVSTAPASATSKISTAHVSDRFYRTLFDSLLDPRLATTSKQAMYLNLLFRAMKVDPDPNRVKSFVKRICQIMGMHQPPFICGAFYLLGELFKITPGLRSMLTDPEDDETEHFVDVPDVESCPEDAGSEEEASASRPALTAAQSTSAPPTSKYDGRKRDPRYCHAEITCLWELVPFLRHFHPSVSLHATQLLEGQAITTTADLSLNTLSHFLDRFVYRNPKKPTTKGSSIMQPSAAASASGAPGVVQMRGQGMGQEGFVNDEKFWKKKAGDVPVDQLFFHKFFSQKIERAKALASKNAKRHKGGADESDDDEQDESEEEDEEDDDLPMADGQAADEGDDAAPSEELDSDEDEEEKEIWAAMKRSMPGGAEDAGLMEDSEDDEDLAQYDYEDSDEEGVAGADGAEGAGEDEDEDDDEDDEEGDEVDSEDEVEDEDGPQLIDGFDDFDQSAGRVDNASDDEGPNVFSEDEDDLIPFADFEEDDSAPAAQAGKKRGAAALEEDVAEQDDEVGGKKSKSQQRRAEKKARKALPMFASADDYAHMLASDDEGNL